MSAPRHLAGLALFGALLLSAPAAFAEGGPHGAGTQESIEDLARRITRALKANEKALEKLARGEVAETEAVDIRLPENGGSSSTGGAPAGTPSGASGGEGGGSGSGGEAAQGLEELLRSSAGQGAAIASGIGEILRMAQSQQQSSGGGGGQPQHKPGGDGEQDKEQPKPGDKTDEPEKDAPKPGEEEPKGEGDPKDGEKNERDPKNPPNQPPEFAKERPSEQDLAGVFLARLPDKVRRAVLAGDFDQVPEAYRDLVREWTKTLAEEETEDQ